MTPFLKSADVQLSKNGLLFYPSKENLFVISIRMLSLFEDKNQK